MEAPTDTVFLCLGPVQVAKLRDDLDTALSLGSESVILMSSNKPGVVDRMLQMKEGDEGSLADLPNPDVLIFDFIYTIGLPVALEELARVAQAWSSGESNGEPQGGSQTPQDSP